MMIGKIISQLLGGGEREDRRGELLDFEEGGWVIVNLPEVGPLLSPEASEPLGELLLEQPSMSVLQMRRRMSAADLHDEGEEESSNENEEDLSSRPLALRPASLAFRRGRASWRLAAWGLHLPARALPPPAERKRLSRGALLRRNLAPVKTRQRGSARTSSSPARARTTTEAPQWATEGCLWWPSACLVCFLMLCAFEV